MARFATNLRTSTFGNDADRWWPSRTGLDRATLEIEAESVVFIVTSRCGLAGSSAAYVSRYMGGGAVPASVSLDHVAKVAGKIEEMGSRRLTPRKRSMRTVPHV
jgi:hypothetical protein